LFHIFQDSQVKVEKIVVRIKEKKGDCTYFEGHCHSSSSLFIITLHS